MSAFYIHECYILVEKVVLYVLWYIRYFVNYLFMEPIKLKKEYRYMNKAFTLYSYIFYDTIVNVINSWLLSNLNEKCQNIICLILLFHFYILTWLVGDYEKNLVFRDYFHTFFVKIVLLLFPQFIIFGVQYVFCCNDHPMII